MEVEMKLIQDDIRYVQWCWDLVIVFYGIYMYVLEEGLWMFGMVMDKVVDVCIKLVCLLVIKGIIYEIQILDILIKEKVQQVIGLNME